MNIPNFNITFEELKAQCEEGKFDVEYAEYILNHADRSVVLICNGRMLTVAMEQGYLFEDFIDYLWFTMFKAVAV